MQIENLKSGGKKDLDNTDKIYKMRQSTANKNKKKDNSNNTNYNNSSSNANIKNYLNNNNVNNKITNNFNNLPLNFTNNNNLPNKLPNKFNYVQDANKNTSNVNNYNNNNVNKNNFIQENFENAEKTQKIKEKQDQDLEEILNYNDFENEFLEESSQYYHNIGEEPDTINLMDLQNKNLNSFNSNGNFFKNEEEKKEREAYLELIKNAKLLANPKKRQRGSDSEIDMDLDSEEDKKQKNKKRTQEFFRMKQMRRGKRAKKK